MKLKYTITGTGRCGTLNIARNFTLAGIPCGHESIFDIGGIDTAKKRLNGEIKIHASGISTEFGNKSVWFDPLLIQADSSYMAAPFLEDEVLRDTIIIHLKRDPLKVISSFVKNLGYFKTLDNPWEKFIYLHVPTILDFETPLERACEYYIKWNEMISKHNVVVHKIEDNPNILFEKLNLSRLEKLSNERNFFNNRKEDFQIEEIPNKFKERIYEIYETNS